MRKIGNFTFGRNKKGKLFWAYYDAELLGPHIILWRLFWQVPYVILMVLGFVVRLMQYGPDAAKGFWDEVI